jgi:FAD/FMN-containing dehydrogenase
MDAGLADAALARLDAELPDRTLRPGDPGYDAARGLYFTAVDRRPAAIVRPRSSAEVALAVRRLAGEGHRLTVKGGGHGFRSQGVADGVVALDLSALNRVEVNPGTRLARAGGGTTTGAFTAAAGEYGLATGFGDSPRVGIGGITQAGGIGFLHRSLGMTIDSLVGAEVVTADGATLEVSEMSHPDLFWAIRGGGGGFGVVTRFDFRVHPVDRVIGGMLMAPATPEVFHAWLELLASAPEALSGLVQALRAPPAPIFPPELHGTMLLAAYVVHSGDPDEGTRWIDRFRALSKPVMDEVAPLRYAALFDEHGGPPAPPMIRWRSCFRGAFTLDEVRTQFDLLAEPHEGLMRVLQVRALGGAMARIPSADTAFAHRRAAYLASVGAVLPGPEQAPVHSAWVERAHAEVAGSSGAGSYAGFLGDEDPDGCEAAWPASHRDRLRTIRARYDPDEVFTAAFA